MTKFETVYVTEEGVKRLSEMTKEELIAALEETVRELTALRAQAAKERTLFAGAPR